jgi:hypothetical protein
MTTDPNARTALLLTAYRKSVPLLVRHRSPIAALLLVVGTFAWTNWYFSPEARIARLASDLHESAAMATSDDDINSVISALKSRAGGFTHVHSTCVLLPRCSIENSMSFPMSANIPRPTMYLTVTVYVKPIIQEQGWLGILPANIRWEPVEWRWSVKVFDVDDSSKQAFYSGTFGELAVAPKVGGGNAVASLLRAMGVGMEKRLVSQK